MKRTLLLAALLLGACAKPQPAGNPDIMIASPWARATIAGQNATAAYMRIANFGGGADKLLSVSAQAPVTAMLHQTSNEGGVSKMRSVSEGLPIPARQSVTLEPGGTHIMVMGLQAPLKPGDVLKLTLKFQRSGEKPVDALVTGAEGP